MQLIVFFPLLTIKCLHSTIALNFKSETFVFSGCCGDDDGKKISFYLKIKQKSRSLIALSHDSSRAMPLNFPQPQWSVYCIMASVMILNGFHGITGDKSNK